MSAVVVTAVAFAVPCAVLGFLASYYFGVAQGIRLTHAIAVTHTVALLADRDRIET